MDTWNYLLELYGNQPIIVNRRTGALAICGHSAPLDSVDGYERLAASGKWQDVSGGWYTFGTIAVAYAECGEFDKATEHQSKAIDLAEKDKNVSKEHLDRFRSRLEHYKQKKPYIVEPNK